MSNYYEKRKAKVRIAHELMNLGWDIEEYYPDESDSMTDYYHPACWGGIATKNGFVLVVDNSYTVEAKEITQYNPKGNLSIDDREKISKLEQMTVERGCTEGEEQNAKSLIEKIQAKVTEHAQYEVIGMTTAHMGNPKGSIWHIEKDGKIYDKGRALTKFSDVPELHIFNIAKMEYTDSYKYYTKYEWINGEREVVRKERTLTDEERKIINEFKSLILRFERAVNGMNAMGDGTKETEQAAQEQQIKEGYEKVIVTETKTAMKMVEDDSKEIKVGLYLSFNRHGGYWLITDVEKRTGTWKVNGVSTKLEKNTYSYERVGAASRGYQKIRNTQRYYQWEDSLQKEITNGSAKLHELKELTEDIQVEKWVKIDKTKKTYNKKTVKKEEQQAQTLQQKETTEEIVLNHDITITADTDTRDNTPLWVVKLVNKVDYEDFKKIEKEIMKPNKGYYSRFKGGFIFKYDPTKVLKTNSQPLQEQEINYNEIADGIIDMSTEIIQNLNLTSETKKAEDQAKENVIDFEEYKYNSEGKKVENTNNSNDFNIDDIFNQFDNIEINNNSRISEDDEKFCMEKQKAYNEFIEYTNSYIQYLKDNSFSNIFLNSNSLINEMNEKRVNNKDCFITKIVNHFKDKYKVTLEYKSIQYKYDINSNINYNIIVTEIIDQLGGYSFSDKAEKELKDEFKNTIRHNEVNIKNTKISINSFFYIDSWDVKYKTYKVAYSCDEKFRKLFKAFSHFLYKSNDSYFSNLYNIISNEKDEAVFKTHEIANKGITALKLYKNGKIDIEFSSSEYTRKFAKEYCGYIEKSA